MKNNKIKRNYNQVHKLFKIAIPIILICFVVILTIPTYIRERSFDILKKDQTQEVMSIIRDKMLTYSEIDTLLGSTRKHSYESFACQYRDSQDDLEECNKEVSMAEERNYEYIKLGLPASEYLHMTVPEMREYLGSFLKDNNYIYDRFTQYPGKELQILFSSKKVDKTTIMLSVDLEGNPHEISSFTIGETDIFDSTF